MGKHNHSRLEVHKPLADDELSGYIRKAVRPTGIGTQSAAISAAFPRGDFDENETRRTRCCARPPVCRHCRHRQDRCDRRPDRCRHHVCARLQRLRRLPGHRRRLTRQGRLRAKAKPKTVRACSLAGRTVLFLYEETR